MEELKSKMIKSIEDLQEPYKENEITKVKQNEFNILIASALEFQAENTNAISTIFYDLYSRPDISVSELISSHNFTKKKIKDIFRKIKKSETLQYILDSHPIHGNFFHKMKSFLDNITQIEKMIKNEPAFPLYIEMHPSIKCNSKCDFCYSKDHWFYEQIKQGMKPLSIEAWTKIINECADNGTKKILPVGGLEPLMAMDKFIAIINTAHKRNLDTLVFTNGISFDPLNKELIDAILRKGSYFLSIRSIYQKTYTEITNTSPLDFKNSIDGIKFLAKEKKKRDAITTLGFAFFIKYNNYHELPIILNLAREIGIDEVGLSCDNLSILPGFKENQYAELKYLLRKHVTNEKGRIFDGLKITLNDTLRKLAYPYDKIPEIYNYKLKKPKSCKNWYIKAAIDPFGNFYNCCLLSQPGISILPNIKPLGTITNNMPLSEIINKIRNKEIKTSECLKCNPSEYNGLIAFEKLKKDLESGIELKDQPYSTK